VVKSFGPAMAMNLAIRLIDGSMPGRHGRGCKAERFCGHAPQNANNGCRRYFVAEWITAIESIQTFGKQQLYKRSLSLS